MPRPFVDGGMTSDRVVRLDPKSGEAVGTFLRRIGATVIVEAPTPLKRLIEDVEGVSAVLIYDIENLLGGGYDFHCLLILFFHLDVLAL